MSRALVIETETGRHLGFLLLAGGPDAGDCLFRPLPMKVEDFDLPEFRHLETLKARGELRWRRIEDGLSVEAPDGVPVSRLQGRRLSVGPFVLTAFDAGGAQ